MVRGRRGSRHGIGLHRDQRRHQINILHRILFRIYRSKFFLKQLMRCIETYNPQGSWLFALRWR